MKRLTEVLWSTIIPRSPVFTTRDAAAAAARPVATAARDLTLLAERGLISKIARGVWANTKDPRFSTFAVVPALVRLHGPDAVGYVSLLSALSLHGMLSQVPRATYVVCNRRALRRRATAFGTYEFFSMRPSLVGGFHEHRSGTFHVATPEKAVFDTLYYSTRRGARFTHLTGVALPSGFSVAEVRRWINRIEHASFRAAVAARLERLRLQHGEPGVA